MSAIEKIKKNWLVLLVGITYIALLAFKTETAILAFKNSTYFLIEMVQVLPVIFILTVVIEAWIPKETIMKHFGENSGIKGNLFSIVLGSLSAGPIYAAFPLTKMLLRKGASVANIVIILSCWAVIKVPMLANEAKFLGIQFMALRWILTVIAILGMAYVINKLVKKSDMGIEPSQPSGRTLVVSQEYCIGCAICTRLAPGTFEMKGKKARVVAGNVDAVDPLILMMAAEQCPASAIVYDGADPIADVQLNEATY